MRAHRYRIYGSLLFVGLFLLLRAEARAQQRPLRTEDADIIAVGKIRAQVGFEFLQKQRYSLSGLEGDLSRLGVMTTQIGVGDYAEFQLSGVVQDFLSISRRSQAVIAPNITGTGSSDVGNLILATKLKLAREGVTIPAFAFKFSVELPNASNESGLGKDQTNFYASILTSKHIGRAQVLGNFGLAILGSPVTPNAQADQFTYGLAAIIPVRGSIELVAEINGRQGPYRVGNESEGQARAGVRFRMAGLRWDLAGIAGLRKFDADSGLAMGVTFEFQAFHKTKSVKTTK